MTPTFLFCLQLLVDTELQFECLVQVAVLLSFLLYCIYVTGQSGTKHIMYWYMYNTVP